MYLWFFSLPAEEDLDGEPVEISDTSNESSQDSDVLLTRLPSFLRGNENSQTSEVTQNASVQTIGPSESVMPVFGNRSETSETDTQSHSNPFEMSLTAYVRSRNNVFGRPPSFQQIEQFIEADPDVSGLDVQAHNNPLRAIFEETVSQQSDSPSPKQGSSQPAEASSDNTSEPTTAEQRIHKSKLLHLKKIPQQMQVVLLSLQMLLLLVRAVQMTMKKFLKVLILHSWKLYRQRFAGKFWSNIAFYVYNSVIEQHKNLVKNTF